MEYGLHVTLSAAPEPCLVNLSIGLTFGPPQVLGSDACPAGLTQLEGYIMLRGVAPEPSVAVP
jgi:hypothetical protein